MVTYHCYRPPHLQPILDLPEVVFRQVCQYAGALALARSEPVTLLGVIPGAMVLCQSCCLYSHADSVVLIPDVVLIELVANGFDATATITITTKNGRSVQLYRVPERDIAQT